MKKLIKIYNMWPERKFAIKDHYSNDVRRCKWLIKIGLIETSVHIYGTSRFYWERGHGPYRLQIELI